MGVKSRTIGVRLSANEEKRLKDIMIAQGKENQSLSSYIRNIILSTNIESIESLKTDVTLIKEELVNLKFGLELMNKENELLFFNVLKRLYLFNHLIRQLPQLKDVDTKEIKDELSSSSEKNINASHEQAFREVFDYMMGKNNSDPLGIQKALEEFAKISQEKKS